MTGTLWTLTPKAVLNGSREDTASAAPKCSGNSGVLTPEVRWLVARRIYEKNSSHLIWLDVAHANQASEFHLSKSPTEQGLNG